MLLHSISYTNIGPFANRTLTVNFPTGKFLINAPIGSGKSFLFFDGPVYALYKYSTRNMLNTQAKTGAMTLIFEIEGLQYCIHRQLKQGKSKDSCTSTLFSVTKELQRETTELLQEGKNLMLELQQQGVLEEIPFKNETDVQKNIDSFLPPREVFLSTHMLMQDTENIFALQPAERLTVFKNIFSLLGIDEGKEKLADRRRELQGQRKVLEDADRFNSKLTNYIREGREQKQQLQSTKNNILQTGLTSVIQFFDDLEHIRDKVTIDQFSVQELDVRTFAEIYVQLDTQKQQYQELQAKITTTQQQYQQEERKLQQLRTEEGSLAHEMRQIEVKIKEIDEAKTQEIKDQKQEKLSAQQDLEKDLPVEEVKELRGLRVLHKAGGYSDAESSLSLRNLHEIITRCIQQGKTRKAEKESLERSGELYQEKQKQHTQKLKELELEEGTQSFALLRQEQSNLAQQWRHEIASLEKDLQMGEEKAKELTKNNSNISSKLQEFEEAMALQAQFHCAEIKSDCPFVRQINTKTFEQLDKQKAALEQEKRDSEQKLKELDRQTKSKEISEKKDVLQKKLQELASDPQVFLPLFFEQLEAQKKQLQSQIQEEQLETKIKELEVQQKDLNQQLQYVGNFLKVIDRKVREEKYQQYETLEKEIKALDENIRKYETLLQEKEKDKQLLHTLTGKQESLQKSIEDQKKLLETLLQEKQTIEAKFDLEAYQSLQQQEQLLRSFEKTCEGIHTLVDEYKHIQLKIKQVLEEEKIVSDLYHIFSKELLLLVLQESVPILTDIMNAYLAQVVDYTIAMEIDGDAEKVALEVKIFDEKGEREVRALSGGQKVVLKLVRMLAVASYTQTQMLFLDETINNLDNDTVGKVADMLEDFVRQRDLKLYVVTHSSQIHDMGIRDDVVQVAAIQ